MKINTFLNRFLIGTFLLGASWVQAMDSEEESAYKTARSQSTATVSASESEGSDDEDALAAEMALLQSHDVLPPAAPVASAAGACAAAASVSSLAALDEIFHTYKGSFYKKNNGAVTFQVTDEITPDIYAGYTQDPEIKPVYDAVTTIQTDRSITELTCKGKWDCTRAVFPVANSCYDSLRPQGIKKISVSGTGLAPADLTNENFHLLYLQKNLEVLDLSYNPALSGWDLAGIYQLFKKPVDFNTVEDRFPQLRTLDLRGTGIPPATVNYINGSLVNIKVLWDDPTAATLQAASKTKKKKKRKARKAD